VGSLATNVAFLAKGRPSRPRSSASETTLLAPVYGWFTEGFDTRDLKEAKALLEQLAI
jgi:predicted ATPase